MAQKIFPITLRTTNQMEPILDGRAAIVDDTIIIADPHLGRTEQLEVGDPEEEYAQFLDKLTYLTDKHSAIRIVIAGDVFDTFKFPPEEAINTVRKLKNFIEARGGELIVTPGNHDTDAIPWESGITTKAESEYKFGDVVALHGHKSPTKDGELYVVGHLHPTIRIQTEKWPSYLYGESQFNGKDVLILPPFNEHSKGVSITAEGTVDLDFPFAHTFGEFEPIVWDENEEEARKFPKLSEFSDQL